jgi:transcriptional regulator with XRE-family HTH domain
MYQQHSKPGNIISARRSELEITVSELASKLGFCSTNLLTMIEANQSSVPLDRVPLVATALQIDQKWFAERVLRDRYPVFADALIGPVP